MANSISDFANDANSSPTASEGITELRSLLLGFEKSEIEELYERLNDPNLNAEDLSRLLPEAIILRSMQDKLLSEAIVPTVEEAIHSSVKKDLNILSEAIFPVMAPAIRKAIATALDTTLQSFNQTIEHSFSPQSFKWRLEAKQTGKTFAEVVLSRTLLYQVEQVFLIHKDTGIVLHHIVKPGASAQDADLVSAMLTAIQSFIQDSFELNKNDSLETLQFGDVTIWLEKGPQAVIAGVIRGHPPQELKSIFQNSIEKIHLKFHKNLHPFKGDTSVFEPSQTYLESCLQGQYKQPNKQKYYPVLGFLATTFIIAIGTWTFLAFRERQHWMAYLEKLNTEPGFVVTKAEKHQGKFLVSGLRDPLAKEPSLILKQANLSAETVKSNWKPYVSLDSEIVTIRAKKILQPPETVSLNIDKNGTLFASGTAPQQWILEARKILRVLPGVTSFNEENLIAIDFQQIVQLKQLIEKKVLLFKAEKAVLIPGQGKILQSLVEAINEITESAKLLNKNVRIQIIGRTLQVQERRANIIFSKTRANTVLSALNTRGLKTNSNISTIGMGSSNTLPQNITAQNQSFNHSVYFKVTVTDLRNSRMPRQ
jgi:outer membrane protein OmpA-like peptidoglycan-associated protein